MNYQVYLDSFLIQEIIINFFVLKLCKMYLLCTATTKRLLLAALFAGIYQVILLFVPFMHNRFLFYLQVLCLYSIGSYWVISIAFPKDTFFVKLKRMSIYLIILFIMGGIITGFLPRCTFYQASRIKPIWLGIFGGCAYLILYIFCRKRIQNTFYGRLKLEHGTVSLEGKYFLDSGNGLIESISGKSVLIAAKEWFGPILEQDTIMQRPVIYKSVGKSRGVMNAYCIDKLVIYEQVHTYTYEKVWVGVCDEALLENERCQVILPLIYGQKE